MRLEKGHWVGYRFEPFVHRCPGEACAIAGWLRDRADRAARQQWWGPQDDGTRASGLTDERAEE